MIKIISGIIALALSVNCTTTVKAESNDFRTEFMVGYKNESESGFIDAEGEQFGLDFVSEKIINGKTYRVVMCGYDTVEKYDDEIVDFEELEIYELEKIEAAETRATQIKRLYDDVFDTDSRVEISNDAFLVYINNELYRTIKR